MCSPPKPCLAAGMYTRSDSVLSTDSAPLLIDAKAAAAYRRYLRHEGTIPQYGSVFQFKRPAI